MSRLSAGLHFFNHRAWSSAGEVSSVYRTMFYLPTADIADVAGYEYWIDDDSLHSVKADERQTALLLDIDVSHLADGLHTLSVRAKNSSDIWGSIHQEEFEIQTFTSIQERRKDDDRFDVYNLRGEKVAESYGWSDLSRLPHSVYVIGGRKVIIR